MAIIRVASRKSVTLVTEVGTDGDGNPILQRKTLSNVKESLGVEDDERIWNTVLALGSLLDGTPDSIEIREGFSLLQE